MRAVARAGLADMVFALLFTEWQSKYHICHDRNLIWYDFSF
jgi:hypothetical protein